MLSHLTDLASGAWRYATGLPSYLSTTIDLDEAKAILIRLLSDREETFLRVLELGIYGNFGSPYRRLLIHAGLQFEDVRDLVRARGLEAALSQLHDMGVFVTLDEFKGRVPVQRPGLEFATTAFDFDNPLASVHFRGSTGGSRGGGSRVNIDFNQMAEESAGMKVFSHTHSIQNYPAVLIRQAPPSTTSLWSLLVLARGGNMPIKWFSPTKPGWNRQGFQGRMMTAYSQLAGRMVGRRLPSPTYEPSLGEIVSYLAGAVRRGRPVQVEAAASEWVRICLAAEQAEEDISGTVFRGAGEPFTEGKAAVLKRVGARGVPNYAMHEAGNLARGCGNPIAPDEMHLMADRLVVLQRSVRLDAGLEVNGLFHTSLRTSAPKIMLNVESGDYGVREDRDCGCLLQSLGFTAHIHHLRSYEKLTSGGVMFMGSMLHELLEESLPNRFGGGPLDYQLVEEEVDGVPRVTVIVSPRIGPLDDTAVLAAVFDHLGFADWSRRQAELWQKNRTLLVQRREPYATRAGKILPLHVLVPTSIDDRTAGKD